MYNSSQVGVINYDNLRQSETTQDPSFILSHDFKSKETLIDLTKQSSDSRGKMEFLKNEGQSQQSRAKHDYELKKQFQHQQYLKSQEREAQQIRIKINKIRQKYNKQINKKTKEQLILMNRAYKPLPKLNQLLNSQRILNIDENAIDNDSLERDISYNDVNYHELRNAKTAYKANRQSRTIEQQVYQQPITNLKINNQKKKKKGSIVNQRKDLSYGASSNRSYMDNKSLFRDKLNQRRGTSNTLNELQNDLKIKEVVKDCLTDTNFDSQYFDDLQIQQMSNFAQKRTMSKDDLMNLGLNYKFSLKDLPKYSRNLNEKDLRDKFNKTVLGKKAPTLAERIKQLEQIQRRLKEQTFWENLRNQALIQQLDWSNSALYGQYKNKGFFKEQNEDIYSQTEVSYYITILRKLYKKKYDDVTKEEIQKAIAQHYDKSILTLKTLMKQICLDYYFERVSMRYEEQNIHNTIKILVRSKKMYDAIDNILIIFKLTANLEKCADEQVDQKQRIKIRLSDVVKQLIQDHKFFQKKFVFKGKDLLFILDQV
eukprot:403371617